MKCCRMKNKKWLGNKIEQEIYKGQDGSKASLCDFNISQESNNKNNTLLKDNSGAKRYIQEEGYLTLENLNILFFTAA